MPGNRIKAGSGDGEMAVVMMVDSGDGGVAGDGTCANDDNDCDGDVVTVVVMVMMVVVRMLARVLLLLAILLYEIYEEVVFFSYDNLIFSLLTVHDYIPQSKRYSCFSRTYPPCRDETSHARIA